MLKYSKNNWNIQHWRNGLTHYRSMAKKVYIQFETQLCDSGTTWQHASALPPLARMRDKTTKNSKDTDSSVDGAVSGGYHRNFAKSNSD